MGGVCSFFFLNFVSASQNWNNMRKFVCSQGHCLSLILLFNFLNLSCFLAVSERPLPHCFCLIFLACLTVSCHVTHLSLSLALSFHEAWTVVDSEYVARLRTSHFKLVPDVRHPHRSC